MSNPMDIVQWLRRGSENRRKAWGEAGLDGCRFDEAANEIERLRAVLQALLNRYVSLVESGDCGNWSPHTEVEVTDAKEALQADNKRL